MKLKSLIWDLDGTLVDSAGDIAASVNHVLQSYQLPALTVEQVRKMIGHGAIKLLERAFDEVRGEALYQPDEGYSRFLAHYRDHCCSETAAFTGIVEVLAQARAMGLKQGVCTNKPVVMANMIVDHLFAPGTFGAVVGGDSTACRKPDPKPLRRCLELMGSDPQEAIMIGDSAADVGVARAGGIPVVLLPWGYTQNGIAELQADYEVQDAVGLLALLQDLVKQ